ncbi:MAG: phosphoglucomutase/phosphomannomutase family protein [Anaerolineae bacterium]|nr:phosphoglucomutase/phosphomannomutase family protein [Anaerolineae bacterium]
MPIHFGTDGWRAVISDDFTFANVRRVSQAIADTLQSGTNAQGSVPKPPLCVVGFDTRFLSDRYAMEVARVLAANGIRVLLTRGDAPTPMVSHAIVANRAAGGVMITASHNAPRYNGIKLKAEYGGSAPASQCRQVEQRITANDQEGREPRALDFDAACAQGLVTRFNPFSAYREHLRTLVDFSIIQRSGLRIVVDPMYGAGRMHLAQLLREAGAEVVEIRGEMNPGFNGIHPEPIARYLGALMAEVPARGYDLGLATDGDADRIGAVTSSGHFVDPHHIIALALRYLVEERGWRGSVVKTVSTTQLVNRLATKYGLPLHETPVGFNYIGELMEQDDVLIGGEESGGISIRGHIPEGDGVLMAMLIAEIVAQSGRPLHTLVAELQAELGPFAYARRDVRVPPFSKAELVKQLSERPPTTLAGLALAQLGTEDGVKYRFTDDSWLLIRPSGTEPVLRVYAEAHTPQTVEALLDAGLALAGAEGSRRA